MAPLVRAVRKAVQLISAELICPGVLFTCHVRNLQADVVACGPCGGQAKLPMLGGEALLGHHGQG